MPLVKVFNDNVHPHKERFKGEMIEIAAGGYVEMEYEEAVDFRGQFTGIAPISASGAPDPKFFKMIRVEKLKAPLFKDTSLVDPVTGKQHSSAAELRAVLSEYGHLRVTDPDAETESKSEVAVLKEALAKQQAQIDALVAAAVPAEKRGPGRPRKEA